jgi:uncharacterized protein (TIGR03086 family)
MTEIQDLYGRALDAFDEKVHAIRDDQWANATPCSEWDVRALVNHVASETMWASPLLEGRTIEQVGDRFDGDVLGADPQSSWGGAAESARAAMTAPRAMDRTVHLSYGDSSANDYAEEMFTDLVIHGWDLARAIGRDEAIDPGFVERIYESSAEREAALKSSGLFGDVVTPPDGADLQTRLLAVFGRVA